MRDMAYQVTCDLARKTGGIIGGVVVGLGTAVIVGIVLSFILALLWLIPVTVTSTR